MQASHREVVESVVASYLWPDNLPNGFPDTAADIESRFLRHEIMDRVKFRGDVQFFDRSINSRKVPEKASLPKQRNLSNQNFSLFQIFKFPNLGIFKFSNMYLTNNGVSRSIFSNNSISPSVLYFIPSTKLFPLGQYVKRFETSIIWKKKDWQRV